MNASVSVDWSSRKRRVSCWSGSGFSAACSLFVSPVGGGGSSPRIQALATRAVVPVGVADVVDDQPDRPPFVLVTDFDLGVVDALCPPLLGRGVLDEVVELPMSCDELVG